MILTPVQIEALRHAYYGETETALLLKQTVHTLAAYAEIVEKIAESEYWGGDDWCKYCEQFVYFDYDSRGNRHIDYCDHLPDCLYIAARKLRQKED